MTMEQSTPPKLVTLTKQEIQDLSGGNLRIPQGSICLGGQVIEVFFDNCTGRTTLVETGRSCGNSPLLP